MSEREENLWGKLFTASEHGRLRWRPDIEAGIDLNDPRRSPEKYMTMCGDFCKPPSSFPPLKDGDLIFVSDNEFVNWEEDFATTRGLLCLLNRFSLEWPRVEEIVVVGALVPESFLSVLSWAKKMGWKDCNVTLVDRSPIPIETLRLMMEMNYIDWPGGLHLTKENILAYHAGRKPDIVIADILNTWMVPRLHPFDYNSGVDSPYCFYEMFLRRMANLLKPDGWFLSRCLVFPDCTETDINYGFTEIAQSGEKQAGEPTMAGEKGEEAFRVLYQKEFDKVRFFKVVNTRSGFRYLYFACRARE